MLLSASALAFFFSNQTRALPLGLQTVLNPNGAPQYSQQIYGEYGMTLNKPMDVTKTNSFIYVSDTNNKRVVVYDITGSVLYTFGEEGSNPGQFNFPYGITTDAEGKVYVADMYNGKISIHDEKGEFIEYFAPAYFDKIKSPAGLRIINEKVYVTDIQSNRVYVLNLQGEILLEVGESGVNEGQFVAPNAVTADKDGFIYVVDTGNARVQIFDGEGNFQKIINGSKDGTGSSVFVNPRGIGIDKRGFIYVVSNLTHLVYGFNKNGEEMFQFGGMGEGNGQLYLPNGLFIDESDTVFITDTLNLRVSVFK